jgi:hypothetical protein
MRSAVSILMSLALFAAAGLAQAGSCPTHMKMIDDKLATKPTLSADNTSKVTKLRADGETAHKAGKHDDSMKALSEAKKILGI